MTAKSTKAAKVFYAYTHKDEELCDKLEEHLSSLRRQGFISEWHERKLLGGTEWKQAIDAHLSTASIILLLISPTFIASDYCYDIEIQQAMCIDSKESATICHLKRLMFAAFRESATWTEAHATRFFSPETHEKRKRKERWS